MPINKLFNFETNVLADVRVPETQVGIGFLSVLQTQFQLRPGCPSR